MEIPEGFSHCCLYIKNDATPRLSCIGFGVYSAGYTAGVTWGKVSAAVGVTGGLKTVMGVNVDLVRLVVTTNVDGSEPLVEDKPLSIACTAATAMPVPSVALLVHKRTAVGGRKGRGRFFIPWSIGEGNMDEAGVITPANVVTAQTAMTTFFNELNTQAVPLTLLHSPDKSGGLIPPTPVTSLVVDGMVASQRRRLGR